MIERNGVRRGREVKAGLEQLISEDSNVKVV